MDIDDSDIVIQGSTTTRISRKQVNRVILFESFFVYFLYFSVCVQSSFDFISIFKKFSSVIFLHWNFFEYFINWVRYIEELNIKGIISSFANRQCMKQGKEYSFTSIFFFGSFSTLIFFVQSANMLVLFQVQVQNKKNSCDVGAFLALQYMSLNCYNKFGLYAKFDVTDCNKLY